MDYKEKYEQVLERARDNYKANQKIGKLEENEVLSDIFPELKGSEDERIHELVTKIIGWYHVSHTYFTEIPKEKVMVWLEKQKPIELNQDNDSIRKELLKHLKEGAEGYEPAGSSEDYARWLAWLEKQKPIELNQDNERIRTGLINGFKQCVKDSPYPKNAQKYWHDIKIEDILAWLERQGEKDKPTYSTYPKDVQLTKEEYDKRRVSDEATIKEVEAYRKCLEDVQRIFEKQGGQNPIEEYDFLKILSNSYSLSFINYLDAHLYEGKMCVSNGECEDIENAFRNADWGKICRYYNKFTQKPIEWSEEDKKKCQETIDWFEKKCFPYALEHENPARESIKWLKSLKPQPKQEWSEKDENMLEAVIDVFNNNTHSGSDGCVVYKDYIDWLKSLKGRIN